MAVHDFRDAFLNSGAAADISLAIERRTPYIALAITDITAKDHTRTRVIHLMRNGVAFVYEQDQTNVAAEDGTSVIKDTEDNPFVLRGAVGASAGDFDAHVEEIEDRDDYDDEDENFTVWVGEEFSGAGGWYVRVTAVAGTWIGPYPLRGPAGDPAVVTGTSTTSLSIATGSKAFTTQEGIDWLVGTRIRASSAADPTTHWMEGPIASYSGDTLTLTIDKTGAGLGDTRADWNLSIAGEPSDVAGADGVDPGLLLNFETATSTPPSAGAIRFDNADLSAATKAYVSKVNRAGSSHAAVLAKLYDAGRTRKDSFALTDPATDEQASFEITGLSDETGYVEFDITDHDGETAFSAGAISLVPIIAAGVNGSGLANIVEDTTPQLGGDLDTDGHQVQLSVGTAIDDDDVDGSNVLTLPSDGNTFIFTGTQQVDTIATSGRVGTEITLICNSARQFTHHADNLQLPGGANYTTVAGDVLRFAEYASGDWKLIGLLRATNPRNPRFDTFELGADSDTTLSRNAAGVVAVEGIPLYAGIPINDQSAAYTTLASDAQKAIRHPAADNNPRTFTIDSNTDVPFPVGTCITFINEINTLTIAIDSDTLVLAGAGSTGSRTLAANGIATAIKVASTRWYISGVGLT